ncbi:MAG TPA: Ig domain-containing protein [Terriglobales bacterium]|nr:Ig domain-containing protein [Terriglobales bacterium]
MRRPVLIVSVLFVAMSTLAAWAQTPLGFVPVNPCRLVDTRLPDGPLGGPSITGGTSRTFNPLVSTSCSLPNTAQAYSLNVTVVPKGNYLGYLTIWPTGVPQPVVSTLNSFDGRIKADAAIVGAGTAGAVSVYVTDTTDVVIDITGYFVPPGVSGGLQFYPLQGSPTGPCTVVDTTGPKGALGGPALAAGTARSFPVSTSTCFTSDPNAQFAEAYSLNVTAVPKTTLGYLTVWNSDFSQPTVSTLNAPTGTVTSNAALIVTASGSISAYPSDAIDLMITTNGYWADPLVVGFSGLSLYTMTPCRALDTRTIGAGDPVVGTQNVDVVASGCVTAPPQGYVMNATVVPTTTLAYLDVSDPSLVPPAVDTLHALDAAVTSNMALVTANCSWYGCTGFPVGSVDYVAASPTAVILDVTATLDYSFLTITTPSLPDAYQGVAYSMTLTGKGGTPPYMWTQTGLPTGLSLNMTTGVISGKTTVASGAYPVTVTLTDNKGNNVTTPYTLTVQPLTGLQVIPAVLPNGQVGVLYDQFVSATGGIPPYTWSVSSGSLPPGVSLSTTSDQAELKGTPTTPGTYSFSLQVTDSEHPAATASHSFTITVN